GAYRPHASRSQQHTACGEPTRREMSSGVARPSGVSRVRARDQRKREASARYTGGGDRYRASKVRSQLTPRRYPYVRSQVPCAPGEKQERQRKKKCSKGLDNYGHIEGLFRRNPMECGKRPLELVRDHAKVSVIHRKLPFVVSTTTCTKGVSDGSP